ncbi:zinc-binding dehydrogenase [Nocardia sp. NPDC057455]|uniref:zinc-dependent alcohol dehydrogenase n=1 Tax=Nocardia sp. NPDC057455 TaxID=3346138 RepID=UPI00366B0499
MKSVVVTGPGRTDVVDVADPRPGPADVLVRMAACGICGSDAMYTAIGGIPPRAGRTPLGHEPAGRVVAVGAEVTGIAEGDHVVVDPMTAGMVGNGGAYGALSEFLLVEDARLGYNIGTVDPQVPFEVAALTEPMAVARHAVNRTAPRPGDTVVVFGAGPIGLGAMISYKRLGAKSVVAVDITPSRLETALAVGADAVINSSVEDVHARLTEIHGGSSSAFGDPRPATDIYLDAAGAPAVIETVLRTIKHGSTLGIVAMHKEPVPINFGALITTEVTIVNAMGYPTEIFEVADDISADWEPYSAVISDRIPFTQVQDALAKASSPDAAGKVVVTFD